MLRALTHKVSSRIADCELTFLERSAIDAEKAALQHEEYNELLRRLGVAVTSMSENDSWPDACFVEDTAVVVDELGVICSMGVPSRREETNLIASELSKYRDLTYITLPATLEGGDVLRIGRKVFVGQSSRTNTEGIRELSRILTPAGYEVVPVTTRGRLHLKSACTAIDDETIFVNPEWVDIEPLKGWRLLTTLTQEPDAANVLRIGTTVCVQAAFPRSAELINDVVPRVEMIDLSELRKAEAGLTCCSIIFES
jgi:dimethylargininase